MIVFNWVGIFMILPLWFAFWLLKGQEDSLWGFVVVAIGGAISAGLDLSYRQRGREESGDSSPIDMLHPSRGGHIMLIPVFAWGGLIALIGVGVCLYSAVMTPMRWVSNFMNTPRPVASPSASGTPLPRAQLQQKIMDDARLTRLEKVERTLKLYESQTPPIVSTSCSQEAGEPLPMLILEVPADIPAQPSKGFIEDQRLLGLKQVVAASEALRAYHIKSVRLELRVRRSTIRVEELNWRYLAETGTVALTPNASADDLLTAYRPTQQCWDSLEQAQHIR